MKRHIARAVRVKQLGQSGRSHDPWSTATSRRVQKAAAVDIVGKCTRAFMQKLLRTLEEVPIAWRAGTHPPQRLDLIFGHQFGRLSRRRPYLCELVVRDIPGVV